MKIIMNYLNKRLIIITVTGLMLPVLAQAQVAVNNNAMAGQNTSVGLAKVVLGLLVVLAVIAAAAWLMKQFVQVKGKKQSVIQIVGGLSVGNRERVVVLEVAGRWLVIGVAAGQVNAIANLDIVQNTLLQGLSSDQAALDADTFTMQAHPSINRMANHTFANWLKKSLDKTAK